MQSERFRFYIRPRYWLCFFYYLPGAEGTVVIPEWLRSLSMNAFLMISGIGILFRKKFLFLSAFLVYPMLILRRFDLIYFHIRAEKHGADLAPLYKAIALNSIFQVLCAALLLYVMLYLLRDNVLSKFHGVTKKAAFINMAVGVCAYMLFFGL